MCRFVQLICMYNVQCTIVNALLKCNWILHKSHHGIQSKIHNVRGKINCVMIYELNTHTVGTKH